VTCQDPKATNVGGPLPCLYPPPVETWIAITPQWKQLKDANGVLQNRFQLCPTPTTCVEVPVRP
jgi:hypothetical protein